MRKSDPKTVFLVRSNHFDLVARTLASTIQQAGGTVVAVVDERAGEVDTGPSDKIPILPSTLANLAIKDLPPNWGWLCGDIWLYAARQHLPDATFFCLLDSDVAISPASAEGFVQAMQSLPQDILAVGLGRKADPPKFSRGLAELGLDPAFGCLFPVVRCSGRAIDLMLDLRRRSLDLGVGKTLNDEAILAGIAQTDKISHAALDEVLPDLFETAQFDTNPPHLAEALWRNAGLTGLLHPVVTLDTVLARIADGKKNYTNHRLRRILKAATADEREKITTALAKTEPPTVEKAKPLRPNGQDTNRARRLSFLAETIALAAPIRVLDIGANSLIEGDAPYVPLLRAGLAEVYGFEPQETALAALNARKSSHEHYFPHALGDGQSGTLHLYRAQGFASLYPINPESAKLLGFERSTEQIGEIQVQTRRLDDLAEIPAVDVLKIDVQGAERNVIANGRTKLVNVLAVVTEVRLFPLYQEEPRFGDLERELIDLKLEFLKFSALKSVPLSRRNRTALRRSDYAQVVDGDAVFVRDLRSLAQMDEETLKRLALIADSVINSIDLTLAVLECLEDRFDLPPTVIKSYLHLLQNE